MPAENVVITAQLGSTEEPIGETTIGIIDNSGGALYFDLTYGDGLHEGGYSGMMPPAIYSDFDDFPGEIDVGEIYTLTYSTSVKLNVTGSNGIEISENYGDQIFGYVVFNVLSEGSHTLTFDIA